MGSAQRWEVVGGGESGGILVRTGQELKSSAEADRLAKGAVVEEVKLVGERLNYKLVSGGGPPSGWVSLKIKGGELLTKVEESASGSVADEDCGGPADNSDAVEVDEELKKKIQAMAEEKKKANAFPEYCMKYKVMGFPLEKPKMRVICLHNAGSTESNYTRPKTPFTNWVKDSKDIELVAVDFPGRNKMLKAKRHESTETLAPDLLAVLWDKISDGVPYQIWGHSVGTWVGFELLMLARKVGLPMPVAAFFMAFPAPHMPASRRRWRVNKPLNDVQFRQELTNWDKDWFEGGPGKVVFDEGQWGQFEPMMRADFRLFDQYKFAHKGASKFEFPLYAWHFDKEHFNSADQIEMWKEWTTGEFNYKEMKASGHLTSVMDAKLREEYFADIVQAMKTHVP